MTPATAALADRLERLRGPVAVGPARSGLLTAYDGLILRVSGLHVPVGTLCKVGEIDAEVIGFSGESCLLMSLSGAAQLVPGARVTPTTADSFAAVGASLLGRVIDGSGAPIDGLGPIGPTERWPLGGVMQNPLERGRVTRPFDVGVRAINALLTVGRGQRVGIMAGSGVGKSVLLGMMTRYSDADVVVGLIGERSREVGDFLATKLAGDAMRRAVVVAVPANHSPVMRLRGARRATAIAEHFRSQGKNVLLILDSLTRVAHAQREIGLALGEPPTVKGYPPSVISLIPGLIERAGNDSTSGGSITAFYTVLADGDDIAADPIVDAARAILDGHFVLSRAQAERGVYPAIDLGASISRVMTDVAAPRQVSAARALKAAHAVYEENRDLVLMGAYARGSDAALDAAIEAQGSIATFVRQDEHEAVGMAASLDALDALFGE